MLVTFPEWRGFFAVRFSPRKLRTSRGGKDPAAKARKPIKAASKRAEVVYWLRTVGRIDIDKAVSGLNLPSRQHLFSYLVNLHRDNGYGYTLEGGCVTLLPPGTKQ